MSLHRLNHLFEMPSLREIWVLPSVYLGYVRHRCRRWSTRAVLEEIMGSTSLELGLLLTSRMVGEPIGLQIGVFLAWMRNCDRLHRSGLLNVGELLCSRYSERSLSSRWLFLWFSCYECLLWISPYRGSVVDGDTTTTLCWAVSVGSVFCMQWNVDREPRFGEGYQIPVC